MWKKSDVIKKFFLMESGSTDFELAFHAWVLNFFLYAKWHKMQLKLVGWIHILKVSSLEEELFVLFLFLTILEGFELFTLV